MLVDFEPNKETEGDELIKECCLKCNLKNVWRSLYTDNKTLLRKCVYDSKQIANLDPHWGPEGIDSPINWMVRNEKLDFLDILLDV